MFSRYRYENEVKIVCLCVRCISTTAQVAAANSSASPLKYKIVAMRLQEFGQTQHRRSCEEVRRKPRAHIQSQQLVRSHLLDDNISVTVASEHQVVAEDHHTVGRQLHIQLNFANSHFPRQPESRQGILMGTRRTPPMHDDAECLGYPNRNIQLKPSNTLESSESI